MPGTGPACTAGVWASTLAAARAGVSNPALPCIPEFGWMRGIAASVDGRGRVGRVGMLAYTGLGGGGGGGGMIMSVSLCSGEDSTAV